MVKRLLLSFILLIFVKSHFGQCDSTIIQGDFFLYNDTTLSGTYYVIGDFKILSGVNVSVVDYSANGCGQLKVYADKIRIDGNIDANHAGFEGGVGGAEGALVSSATGHTNALTSCSGSSNPGQIEVEGGFGGQSGNGPGGGEEGKDGRTGSGSKQHCGSPDEAGVIAGSSGGSAGGGGSYGGLGSQGGYGGDGSASYSESNMDIAQDFAINNGFAKSGGNGGALYGTDSGLDIHLGSGGAGAGGGGRSYDLGDFGQSGGNGGGLVYLKALTDS